MHRQDRIEKDLAAHIELLQRERGKKMSDIDRLIQTACKYTIQMIEEHGKKTPKEMTNAFDKMTLCLHDAKDIHHEYLKIQYSWMPLI